MGVHSEMVDQFGVLKNPLAEDVISIVHSEGMVQNEKFSNLIQFLGRVFRLKIRPRGSELLGSLLCAQVNLSN